jgi:hypothetical protein
LLLGYHLHQRKRPSHKLQHEFARLVGYERTELIKVP